MITKDVKPIIAENLTMLRKKKGITQAELAERLDYSDKAVSRWEHGETLPDIKPPKCPCKYMLYCDYFNDYLDYMTVEGASKTYARHAEELYAIAKKSRKYGYLFNTAAHLCDVLKYKFELGIKTRRAYEAGDKETLRTLAEVEQMTEREHFLDAEEAVAFGLIDKILTKKD